MSILQSSCVKESLPLDSETASEILERNKHNKIVTKEDLNTAGRPADLALLNKIKTMKADGHTPKEIAEETGKTVGAIHKYIFRYINNVDRYSALSERNIPQTLDVPSKTSREADAQIELQRRSYVVYSAVVKNGPSDHYIVDKVLMPVADMIAFSDAVLREEKQNLIPRMPVY